MKIRKKFIVDTVKHYIEHYPEEYELFLRQLAHRRAMAGDKKLGKLQGTSEIRVGVSIPDKVMNTFMYVLKDEEKGFGEEKGELKWFAKKFPQFLLPYEY